MRENISDQIVAYLNGETTEEEARKLMIQIRNDQAVAEEFELLKSIHQSVRYEDFLDHLFALKMQARAQQSVTPTMLPEKPERKNNVRLIRRISMLAAAMLILLLGYFMMFRTHDHYTPKTLFAKYYISYDQLVELRAENDSATMLTIGMDLYKKGNWHEAIRSLDQARQRFDLTASFYIGMCYLELNEFEFAESQFRIVIKQQGELIQEAQWYLALTLLAENHIDDCKEQLQAIVDQENHYYTSRAKKLLKDLKRIRVE